jgi:hypothetical protein
MAVSVREGRGGALGAGATGLLVTDTCMPLAGLSRVVKGRVRKAAVVLHVAYNV